MTKDQLRHQALGLREALTPEQVLENSQKIASQLSTQNIFQQAEHVLFYYPHKREVNVLELLKQCLKKKKVYLPKLVSDDHFQAIECQNLSGLKKNKYGIPEPELLDTSDPHPTLDLILIPGVAFDLLGNRLGMGKGYYDRFLAHYKSTFKIGLAHELQIFDEVPNEPYDENVDMIITEKRIINV